jgi:hypothetical protein
MNPTFVLLLTATIDPGGTPMVARSDPRLRLRDYENALWTWLSSGVVHKIVLFENSGYDITPLKDIARRFPEHEVEFHSFFGNQDGPLRGKGYAELSGIARTLEQSDLIKEDCLIVKCTGRLTVRNARRLLETVSKCEFDIMCMLHDYLTYAESRLFIATRAFISNYLVAQQQHINDMDNVVFENALAYAAASAIADRKKWRPFPIFPIIEGRSGTTGNSITDSAGRRLVRSISYRLRKFSYKN